MASVTLFLAGNKVGSYDMTTSPFVVGRDNKCGLHIDNIGVSRRHCQFIYENNSYFVEDAGSSNGTFFGKIKVVSRRPMADGDEVTIGKYVLLFQDNGLSLLPQQVGGGQNVDAGDIGKTFQMDPQTLRAQMAKAGAASAGAAQAQKASDVAKNFDPDAPLVIKGKEKNSNLLGLMVKLVGLSILVAGLLVGLLFAFGASQ
jgi:predicted component of type VI protein secretion system